MPSLPTCTTGSRWWPSRAESAFACRSAPGTHSTNGHAIEVRGLDFAYAGRAAGAARASTLAVPTGARCLLVGANGSGKTTLLGSVGGRHMAADAAVRVLGRPAFSDTALVHDVSFIGGQFPLDVDLTVDELLAAPARRRRRAARASCCACSTSSAAGACAASATDSAGACSCCSASCGRARCCCSTRSPPTSTSSRAAICSPSCARRTTTILYATHILEGLEDWATHLAYLHDGRIAIDVAARRRSTSTTRSRRRSDHAAAAPRRRLAAPRSERRGASGRSRPERLAHRRAVRDTLETNQAVVAAAGVLFSCGGSRVLAFSSFLAVDPLSPPDGRRARTRRRRAR